MSFQKTHSNYSNDNCIHKRSCRYILEGLLDEVNPTVVNSVTLPAMNFVLEKRLIKKYLEATRLLVCEVNKKIFDNQTKLINDDRILQASVMFTDMVRCHNDVFNIQSVWNLNFIWLDLCGYFTEDTFSKLQKFVANNPYDDKGVFAITLLSSRENVATKKFFRDLTKEKLGKPMSTLQNFRSVQLPKILTQVLNEHTRLEFELSAKYSYKPTSGGGIMTMYAFNWKRK